MILYKLENKKLRYGDIKKIMPNITHRMLTLHLQEMERDGLVNRTVYPEVPPKVEYELTESAMALAPVWKQLEQWGLSHRQIQGKADKMAYGDTKAPFCTSVSTI